MDGYHLGSWIMMCKKFFATRGKRTGRPSLCYSWIKKEGFNGGRFKQDSLLEKSVV
ncbi:unnamed protein product [Dovyalis caffra]|uniref:Uncharacterized protein n=1 Tax=Dovyalis caffra TaxID=77055 RepID=A0AAV1S3Z7_9ROSI|nr:unnamed protein product [Dovyalis caffra]